MTDNHKKYIFVHIFFFFIILLCSKYIQNVSHIMYLQRHHAHIFGHTLFKF